MNETIGKSDGNGWVLALDWAPVVLEGRRARLTLKLWQRMTGRLAQGRQGRDGSVLCNERGCDAR